MDSKRMYCNLLKCIAHGIDVWQKAMLPYLLPTHIFNFVVRCTELWAVLLHVIIVFVVPSRPPVRGITHPLIDGTNFTLLP